MIGLLLATPMVAQSSEPAWLTIERAERAAVAGDFGRAIQLYRRALTLEPGSPEAEFGLARAFTAVNDYPVAEVHFRNALAAQSRLRVPDTAFEIHYGLADLYRVQRRFADYENELKAILALAPEPEITPSTLRRVLTDQGLDRLLVLYRLPEDGTTRARDELAELLVGLGRYEGAIEQALVAVVQQLSTVINGILNQDPDFVYDRIDRAVAAAHSVRPVQGYLQTSTLDKDLYYLAAALFGQGAEESALETWRVVAGLPGSGAWARRASIQLEDPEPEPLIVDSQ